MNITCVTIDCEDPRRTAEFWNEALRWTGVVDLEEGNIAACRPPDGGAYLEFARSKLMAIGSWPSATFSSTTRKGRCGLTEGSCNMTVLIVFPSRRATE